MGSKRYRFVNVVPPSAMQWFLQCPVRGRLCGVCEAVGCDWERREFRIRIHTALFHSILAALSSQTLLYRTLLERIP